MHRAILYLCLIVGAILLSAFLVQRHLKVELKYLEARIAELDGVRADLTAQLVEKDDRYQKSKALFAQTLAEREIERASLQAETAELRSKISSLRRDLAERTAATEEVIGSIRSIEDDQLAQRSAFHLSEFAPPGSPQVEIEPLTESRFESNRSYVEAGLVAALKVHQWQDVATGKEQELELTQAIVEVEKQTSLTLRSDLSDCIGSLEACDPALEACKQLRESDEARLQAELERSSHYERQWKAAKVIGWMKTAAATGIGFLAGRNF